MVNSYVQVPPNSTGPKLLTNEHVIGPNTVQVQAYTLVDKESPTQGVRVDYRGAASVRFSEGSPLADGFGGLKVSSTTTVGLYDFVVDDAADLFSDVVLSGGAISRNSQSNTVSLDVTSANGSFASRTSDKYHYYIPGTSNLVMMTTALSDNSHIGTERRWGLFDTNDGVFFNLDSSGVLNVVLRSTVTGTLVETKFNRVNWNGDKLDGLGLSGFNLDLTKVNVYWIDYQWLGAGRVRFGVMDDFGNRIVAHTILNANHNLLPYMRTGSLPVQVNIQNTALTSGPASIRLTCCSVQTEGDIDYTFWRYNYKLPQKTATTNTYLGALKSKTVIEGGNHNNVNAYPETLSVYVANGSVRLDVIWDFLSLSGTTFALDNSSTVLADSVGSITVSGNEYTPVSLFLDAGSHNIDLSKYFDITDLGLSARADITQEPQYVSIVATSKSGTPTVEAVISYRELR